MSANRLTGAARRSFLSRLGSGIAAFGAVAVAAPRVRAEGAGFAPARHAQDDWMDGLPGKHRFLLDATSPAAIDDGRRFASNFVAANKSGYGLEAADLAVVIVMRHHATPFAYNDAMWAKYGAPLAAALKFTDPATNRPPTTNVYNTSDLAFDGLARLGVHFAVCGMATRFFAGVAARATGGAPEAVYEELVANLIGHSHVVPAGIVAVNRAQERGYTFAYAG